MLHNEYSILNITFLSAYLCNQIIPIFSLTLYILTLITKETLSEFKRSIYSKDFWIDNVIIDIFNRIIYKEIFFKQNLQGNNDASIYSFLSMIFNTLSYPKPRIEPRQLVKGEWVLTTQPHSLGLHPYILDLKL